MPTEPASFASFILTYDRPAVLRRTIASVLEQTQLPDVLLVVDNGTDPATRRLVDELAHPLIEYVATGDNLGSAGGVAFGMRQLHARGYDWIHSIDDDDPPRTSDTIARLRDLIARHDDGRLGAVAAVGSLWDWHVGEYRRLPDDALHGDLHVDVIGGGQHLTVSHRVISEIGTPEPRFFFGYYDPLYCLRIARAGYRLMVDGDLMYRYRAHAGRLDLEVRRAIVPADDYEAIWRRYYTTRNYVYRMTRTFDRPDLARREAGKALGRAAASWARGPRYGGRYTRLQLRGVVDGYRGRLGRTVVPERKAQPAADSPLRILQVVTCPQRRGAEVFAHDLSDELRRHDCIVRTAYVYPHTGPDQLQVHGHDRILGEREDHPFERFLGLHPVVLARLRGMIADFRPDIVQVNGSRSVKYGAIARMMSGSGWVLVYRNIGEPRAWVRTVRHRLFYRRVVMPRVDGVVAVGEAMVGSIRSFYGTRAPMVRIPRALDVAGFVPRRTRNEVRAEVGADPSIPVVLFVGSLSKEKRPDRLVRVFHEVRASVRDAELWIVGEGPLEAAVEAEVRALGERDSVRLLGVRGDVADIMHAADVFLLTSDTEGIPGVLLEAGAASLPSVATRVGSVPECIIDGHTGLLADVDDELGLAKATIRLLRDEFARRSMGIEARRWVAQEFSLETVAREYIEFYRRVLLETRQRSGVG